MSIEREFFFTYAGVKNLNYNFSALKDLTVSLSETNNKFKLHNIFQIIPKKMFFPASRMTRFFHMRWTGNRVILRMALFLLSQCSHFLLLHMFKE